jgi:hypothetical protein
MTHNTESSQRPSEEDDESDRVERESDPLRDVPTIEFKIAKPSLASVANSPNK